MIKFLFIISVLVCLLTQIVLSSPHQDGKIIGGTQTTIEKYPYIVSFRYMTNHRCGGSIFTFKTVLVAGNCVLGLSINYMEIVAGATKRSEDGVRRLVREVIFHEDFDAYYRRYDIALLILDKPFFFTHNVQSISQPGARDIIRPGIRAYIAGWGAGIDGQDIQDNLHYTDLYIIDNEECGRRYKGYFEIVDHMICAVPWIGIRGSCYGDSGGPLVVEGKVQGIILQALGCGENAFPGIFLKISLFREWIKEQLLNRGMVKDLKLLES